MEEMDHVNRLSSSSASVGIEGDGNPNRDEKIGSSSIGLDREQQQHADQKLCPSPPSAAMTSLKTTCEAEGEREGEEEEEEEDPGARTIEFLRARLLSERSVSKAARQRAELLAQKVLEVERQLEIVVEQRKKAEEDTRQALALLEDCTVADYSDAFDSGADQDAASLHLEIFQRISTSSSLSLTFPGEEDEISTMSSASEKTLQNSEVHIDEQDGPERSHRVCRGLSWQARGNSRNQHENKKAFQTLEQIYLKNYHHGGVSDAKSGSRRRAGKSCRQIKRRETRPVTEEELRVSSDCGEEDKTKKPTESMSEPISEKDSEGSSLVRDQKVIYDNTLNQGTEERDEIDLRNDQIGEQTSGEECTSRVHPERCVPYPSEYQERQIESGSDKEMEMERVLEQRAELIDQYEAEEDAQREWEEKFKELNCPPEQGMDCCRYEKQIREREVSKDQEGGCLNRSKNVAPTLNGEKKESNERSCESTSEKSHTVYSHCNDVENKAIHQMDTNESQTCYVHGIWPNCSCRLICSCDASSISKVEKVKGLPVLTNNFVQDISLGNMQESQGNACAKTVSKEEKQEGGMPNYDLNSVTDLQVSNKDVETTDCIAEPSDNVDENMIGPYCCDIGPNLTEKAVLLEKHIPIVSHANELLKLSASPVHDKALDAMHAMRVSGKDAVQGLPYNVRPTGEMVNTASMTQALKSEKHCSESKMARGDYKSSGGMMLATGKKPQNISHGSILRNSAEIITDSIPKECRGYSQSWHGSSNADHRLSLMQGHRADLVANTTCASIHPYVPVNPMKSMSSLKMGSMEMQGQKENEEHFDRTDYHWRASTSDENSMTRSQENIQVRPFNGQPERSTGLNESKMTNVEDITPGPTTQNVRGVSFSMPYCGIRSSDILERRNTFVANHIPENRFCRTNMQDPSHVMINKIDTSPESREYYASLKHSGRVSQRTSESNDSSFQKNISRLDINNWSSAHELTDNYKNHSRGLFCGQRVNPSTGNMGSSSMREFETYSELHTGNGTREESRMCQINQDHNRYAERVQLVAHHQSDSSRDVLMVLQLAKLELQNTLDKTQSVIQHPKIRAGFMEESSTQKVMQPGNFVGAPLSCNELFRLPPEIDCKLPSQSRPYLPDFNHNNLVGVPNNLSASVLNKLSANTSGRERPNLHFKHNQSDVDLSRRQWPSAGNQHGQQISYGFDDPTVARGQWSSADNKRRASEKS